MNDEYLGAQAEADRRNAEAVEFETRKILADFLTLRDVIREALDNEAAICDLAGEIAMFCCTDFTGSESRLIEYVRQISANSARLAARDEVRSVDADTILDERRKSEADRFDDKVDAAYEAAKERN